MLAALTKLLLLIGAVAALCAGPAWLLLSGARSISAGFTVWGIVQLLIAIVGAWVIVAGTYVISGALNTRLKRAARRRRLRR